MAVRPVQNRSTGWPPVAAQPVAAQPSLDEILRAALQQSGVSLDPTNGLQINQPDSGIPATTQVQPQQQEPVQPATQPAWQPAAQPAAQPAWQPPAPVAPELNWADYRAANPDVDANYYATVNKQQFPTPDSYARFHYQNYGINEGRTLAPAAQPAQPAAPQGNLDAQPAAQPAAQPDWITQALGQADAVRNNVTEPWKPVDIGGIPATPQGAPAAAQGNLGAATPAQGDGLVNGQAPLKDWDEYLQKYPDVMRDWLGLKASVKAKFGSPAEYAEYHYRANGQREGRAAPVTDNTYTLRTNARDVAGGVITADPNANYRLVDNRSKATVAGGMGTTGLDSIYQMADHLEQVGGKKANWDVQQQDANGNWVTVSYDKKDQTLLGKVADVALPVIGAIAGSLLLPGVGTVLGAGIGGAGGSAASSAMQGRSIGDLAKRALISGALSAGGAGIGGALSGAGNAAANFSGGALGEAASGGLAANFAGNVGGNALSSLAGGALGEAAAGGLGGSFAGALGGAAAQTAADVAANGIIVNATKPLVSGLTSSLVNTAIPVGLGAGAGVAASGALGGGTPGTAPSGNSLGDPDIVAEAARPTAPLAVDPAVVAPTAAAAALPTDIVVSHPKAPEPASTTPDPVAPAAAAALPTDIVVNAKPKGDPPLTSDEVTAITGTSLISDAMMDEINKLAEQDYKLNPDKKGLSVSDIVGYLRLAALAVTLGGSLLGDKGKTTKLPAGFNLTGGGTGDFAPDAKLPAANGSAATAATRTARALPVQDWGKYAQRPEQSFYSDVPATYIPPVPGVEDPRFPSMSRGYAKGGKVRPKHASLAVRGPGTERSDSIPAYLSDGEYVIDAPTVRAIGSGDRERGFKRLDDLRVQVRRKASPTAPKSLGAR